MPDELRSTSPALPFEMVKVAWCLHGSAVWRYRQRDMVGVAGYLVMAVSAVIVVLLPVQ